MEVRIALLGCVAVLVLSGCAGDSSHDTGDGGGRIVVDDQVIVFYKGSAREETPTEDEIDFWNSKPKGWTLDFYAYDASGCDTTPSGSIEMTLVGPTGVYSADPGVEICLGSAGGSFDSKTTVTITGTVMDPDGFLVPIAGNLRAKNRFSIN